MTKPQHFKRTARKELTLFPDELLEIIKAAEPCNECILLLGCVPWL